MLESLFNKVAGLQVCNFIKKETLAQVFSCEFCEIFKNTYFEEHLQTAASNSFFQEDVYGQDTAIPYVVLAKRFPI